MVGRRIWPDAVPRVARLAIVPSNGAAIVPSQLDPDVAVSPDGSRVGFFSPDGESIGFFDGAALKRVSANGGPVVTIAPITGPGLGASWGDDGSIVYKDNSGKGLMRISDTGGEAVQITTEINGENHVLPEFLPGARAVLFTRMPPGLRGSEGQISVLDLESGAVKTLASGGSQARYAASSHMVYSFSGTLRAVRLDVKTLTAHGNPVPVIDQVITKASGAANFALSANGSLVYEAGDLAARGERTLVWVDRNVSKKRLRRRRGTMYIPASPRMDAGSHWIFETRRATSGSGISVAGISSV